MAELGLNIDHVATLRQARMGLEPEPVYAALIAEQNGADQITIHLREDRRHIQLRDLKTLKNTIQTRLNLEMALTNEIIAIAKSVKPHTVTLVPERREELTTEGGLNLNIKNIDEKIKELQDAGLEVSLFLEPDADMIRMADRLKVNAVEIHTGIYANAGTIQEVDTQLARIAKAAKLVKSAGMKVVAGHGLNYHNVHKLVELGTIQEYNIGHSIVSRAVFTGMAEAVSSMKKLIS